MHSKERFQNNYDFLRIFAAFCIIFFHSFGLLGKAAAEPLVKFSNGRINFSFIGLCIFFCISGYLIAKSAVKSPSIVNYLWKRLLRIQPLLIVTCFVTVFLIGPVFTSLSFKSYFSDFHTYSLFQKHSSGFWSAVYFTRCFYARVACKRSKWISVDADC